MVSARVHIVAALAACAAIGLAACGGGGGKTTVTTTRTVTKGGPTSTTVQSSPSRLGSPSRTVHLANFRSPSGNIGCVIAAGTARCDIAKRRWSPPSRPSSCPSEVDFGQGLEVSHSGKGKFVCAGDTARDPSSKPLAYGEGSNVDGFLCISRPSGIACADTSTNHGFALSVQGYGLF